ncbi:cytochrome c oxidase assembly protein [Thermomonospora cellulosilytica]|uniref:Putative copper resistance protein D n=1 Tax=Thermomonospora cellulosilytica TaxID=1411118 RepID=A0A7W3N4W8_9ACTN|nr:cytochrome c oxidase assembly protein [Thermomonospora cellulosilytica]MBA9007587.1 putative copper resistance protein D [Thermomonospora cellulosilytica]
MSQGKAPATVPRSRGPSRPWALWVAAAFCTLAVALRVGGAAATVPWLEGSGGLTRGGLPVAELAGNAAAAITVGLLAAAALLLPDPDGALPAAARRCLSAAGACAAGWAAATLVTAVLSASYLLARPVWQVSDAELLGYLAELPPGRALVAVTVLAGSVAVLAWRARTANGAGVALLVALAGLLPPVVTGHAASSDDHPLMVVALGVHVAAASVWVGGLVALVALPSVRDLLPVAVPRYSALAAVCFAAVAASGLVTAWVQLGRAGAVTGTGYGLLVAAKTVVLGALGLMGWRHRRAGIPALADRPGVFLRLAVAEVAVMAAAMALATGLSRTAPPAEDTGPTSPAGILLGFEPPGPVGAMSLAFDGLLDPLFLILVAAGAVLYAAGVRRVGRGWPVRRTAAWYGGLAIVLAVTCGGVATYSMVLLSVHVVQHLALTLAASVLLVAGAPVELALRALRAGPAPVGRTPRDVVLAVLGGRVARAAAHPVGALAAVVLTLYGFYASPWFEASLRGHVLHSLSMAAFLAAGMLFARAVAAGARWLVPALAAFHLVFGYAFRSASGVLAADWYDALALTWGAGPERDQRTAGLLLWAIGVPATAVILLLARRARVGGARQPAGRVATHDDGGGTALARAAQEAQRAPGRAG